MGVALKSPPLPHSILKIHGSRSQLGKPARRETDRHNQDEDGRSGNASAGGHHEEVMRLITKDERETLTNYCSRFSSVFTEIQVK